MNKIRAARELGRQADSLRWEKASRFPEDERDAVRRLVAAGTPIARLHALGESACEECRAFGFALTNLGDAKASLRALDGWEEGDGVVALTGYTFDLVGVGDFHTYAHIEERVRSVGVIGAISTPVLGLNVLVPVERAQYSFAGIDLLSLGAFLILPGSGATPRDLEGVGYRWVRGPDVDAGGSRGPGVVAALHELSRTSYASNPSIFRDGGCIPPRLMALLNVMATDIIFGDDGSLVERLTGAGRAAGSLLVGHDEWLDFTERYLLLQTGTLAEAHETGMSACLRALQSGLAEGTDAPAPDDEIAGLGNLTPCTDPRHMASRKETGRVARDLG